ncbi:CPBP family intramembrane glutamic endopeptidase [Neobacillus terrae]|uniref:CPBP family intramembrane glutamic endopeptidase n=1 Tax=Neobacillus terrae TaxID=3034837 RepID=UPI00140A0987|nr:type II CAAX endopeptidase family protein [Neobacillus terrae]NHM29585.1 CPBP family intramembrane metalloprotease [Neobacillus terrae]
MKATKSFWLLLVGFFIAHFLIYFSFQDKSVFWYIFTASYLLLITFTILLQEVDDETRLIPYLFYGIISGLFLYGLFWTGFQAMQWIYPPVYSSVNTLYNLFSPYQYWHYFALFLIAVPGEEIFWRGFVQKRVSKYFGKFQSVAAASILYASVHIYSGQWILILAAFLSGLVWGLLYIWKRSMPLVIISHLVFDAMVFVLYPLE